MFSTSRHNGGNLGILAIKARTSLRLCRQVNSWSCRSAPTQVFVLQLHDSVFPLLQPSSLGFLRVLLANWILIKLYQVKSLTLRLTTTVC